MIRKKQGGGMHSLRGEHTDRTVNIGSQQVSLERRYVSCKQLESLVIQIMLNTCLSIPAGNAGAVCPGQQPRRSDAPEAGRTDGSQQESHTGEPSPIYQSAVEELPGLRSVRESYS